MFRLQTHSAEQMKQGNQSQKVTRNRRMWKWGGGDGEIGGNRKMWEPKDVFI